MRILVIATALALSATGLPASPRYSEPVRDIQFEFEVDSRPVFVRVKVIGQPPKETIASFALQDGETTVARGRSSIRLTFRLVGKVTYRAGALARQIDSAEACATEVSVTGLDLNNSPNWLDSTVFLELVDRRLQDTMCIDITQYVELYLAAGNSL